MKAKTENEYQLKVNQVIDYINGHLHESLKLESLAQRMCISSYHFHRIMRAYLNEPLALYITRQRMERAAMYLKTKDTDIKELAEMVGYATLPSFSKAFRQYFGVTPTVFKDYNKSESFYIQKGRAFKILDLNPDIVDVSEMNLIYVRILGIYGEVDAYTNAWNKLGGFLKSNNLLNKSTRWFGISHDDPNITHSEQLRFYACASVPEDVSPNGQFGTITINKGRFAVYIHKGCYDGLQNFHDNIYYQMEYPLRDAISLEEYVNSPHNTEEEDLITKVYIPII